MNARVEPLQVAIQQMTEVTVNSYREGLFRHMPAGPYRDFHLWGLDLHQQRHEDFIQVLGITQLAKLSTALLFDLVDQDTWRLLLPYCGVINPYLTYEAISDNLAIGVASLAAESKHLSAIRRRLLCVFNEAMIDHLLGKTAAQDALAERLLPFTENISLFDQCLAKSKSIGLAEQFLNGKCNVAARDLDFAATLPLVANVHSCVEVANAVRGSRLGDVTQEGLIRRYRAVSRLLNDAELSLEEVIDVSTYAILVSPTLAFYIAALDDIRRRRGLPRFDGECDLIAAALYDAATLVRLLNDMGTVLLRMPEDNCSDFLVELEDQAGEADSGEEAFTFLSRILTGRLNLTRLHKDLEHGEFNVSFFGIDAGGGPLQAAVIFRRNVQHLRELYLKRYQRLEDSLNQLSRKLKCRDVSRLVIRFVEFHEKLYSNPYTSAEGEYAI